jgi:hypothetical protein
VEAEYDLALRSAEATWVRSLIEELSSGGFPGLAEWRAWHESGRLPTQQADLPAADIAAENVADHDRPAD